MINDAQQAVQKFHRVFNLPIGKKPHKLDKNRVEIRVKWMIEEITEFIQAVDLVSQADAIADLIYFAIGVFVEMGVDGENVFELVHQANMKKSISKGKILHNSEGRILKPDGWISPDKKIRELLSEIKIQE